MPYSIIEAMMSGLVVVATDVGGVREAIGSGGLVVPPRSPQLLGDAFLKVLRDPYAQRRLGSNGYERSHNVFRLDTMLENYRSLYRRVIAQHLGARDADLERRHIRGVIDRRAHRSQLERLARRPSGPNHRETFV